LLETGLIAEGQMKGQVQPLGIFQRPELGGPVQGRGHMAVELLPPRRPSGTGVGDKGDHPYE